MKGSENKLALHSYMLTCLNQHSAAVVEWSMSNLHLRTLWTAPYLINVLKFEHKKFVFYPLFYKSSPMMINWLV